MSKNVARAAAIVATLYAIGILIFINWAGSVYLEVPLWVGVLSLVSAPVSTVVAGVLWTKVVFD
jgi:hypothetical protein